MLLRTKPSPLTVSLVIAHLVVMIPAMIAAQVPSGCRPRNDHVGFGSGYVTSDGRRHIRLGLEGDVSPEMRAAFNAARQAWNEHTNTTNIVFDELDSGQDLVLRITNQYSLDGNCITQPRSAKYINYNSVICHTLAQQPGNDMVDTLVHEIGHFLGLEHHGDGLMQHCGENETCEQCLNNRPSIDSASVERVVQCNSQQEEQYDGGYYDDVEQEETYEDGLHQVCDNYFRVWTTYVCSGSGCSSYVTVEYLGSECYYL